MKKIVCMLLLIQSGFMMAQTTQTEETFVTVNGKRVKINPNSLNTADNGLTADSSKVQLGGALLKPTKITTTVKNTLTIEGLQVGVSTDNILVADTNGVLKLVKKDSIGDNLGNHFATQDLNLDNFSLINNTSKNPNFGLKLETINDEDNVRISSGGLQIDFTPKLKPNDPSEKTPNGFEFITQNDNGLRLRSTSLHDLMDAAQNQYFMPKIDLINDNLHDANLLLDPQQGQFVYNTNPDMENGTGEGIYYMNGNNWVPINKGDDLGNHKATQTLDMNDMPINTGGGDWGLEFSKGGIDFDHFTKDYMNSNYARFGGSFVVIDHLPALKPNDPTEVVPNGFEFVTQNNSGNVLRSTSLNELMDAAQNQYFMPKVSLTNNIVDKNESNLLLDPQNGQFVYNTNPDMENGKGEGIYYNKRGYWVPVVSEGADNLGNHLATQNLNIDDFAIINNTSKNPNFGLKLETMSGTYEDNVRITGGGLAIDYTPKLKPNDPSELKPNGFEFITQNEGSQRLRSTSLNDVMYAAQDQYFMPKISLANDIVGDAEADLLIQPENGQFVWNTNNDMENGAGSGIYYNQSGNWVSITKGLLVDSKTFEIAQLPEAVYPLNTETTIENSTQSIDVKYKSRIVLSGVVTIGVKHNTMGSGYIRIKQNGTLLRGSMNNFKYSVFNPAVDLKADIDTDASLTTSTHFEVVIDNVEPGTHEFSVAIEPTWSAPITPGDYNPLHYTPNNSYMTYKVYNQ